MVAKVEEIRIVPDQSVRDQFLECRFRDTVDVERIAADKQREGFDLLGGTIRIGTVQRLHAVLAFDRCFLPAGGTEFGDRRVSALCQIIRDLRDDHVGLVYGDLIADPKLQRSDDADIVHACAGYGRSFEFHRTKDRNGIDQPCPAGTPFDLKQFRLHDLIRPLKSDRVAREFGRPAKR